MNKLLLACAALTLALAPAAFSEPTPPPATQAADPNANVAAPGVTFNAHSAAPPQQQGAPAVSNEMLAQVQRLLSADWRPVDTSHGGQMVSAFQAACVGTDEEMTALHARLSPTSTVAQIRAIRNAHGLIILPGHTASSVVFFPNAELSWVSSGMGTLIIQDIDHARIDVRDTLGGVLQVQLAQAGSGQAVLRILHNNAQVGLYVACSSTVPSHPAASTATTAPAPAGH